MVTSGSLPSEVDESGRPKVNRIKPTVTNEALNSLFDAAWSQHEWRDFQPVLSRSLTYICIYQGDRLIGFVNLA
jgi:hypothetical protein